MGKPFLPWQRHVADVAYEINPRTGSLAYKTIIVIAPRQEGKTELILPVMTHRCSSFDDAHVSNLVRQNLGIEVPDPGPQRVLYIAQNTDKSREKWRDVHLARLNRSKVLRSMFHPRLQRNSEAFEWRNGSMWQPGSTTAKGGGTGDTLDLGVIDEAWSRPDGRLELGMRPAMKTRPWRQLWIMSMIPGPTRVPDPAEWTWLRNLRQINRARVAAGMTEDVAFFDWTAPEDMDPSDPMTWWTCMPSLGLISDESAVREAFQAFENVADFEAEYLGWEPKRSDPRWTLVEKKHWVEQLADMISTIDGRPAIAVEVAEDRSTGWIGAAGYREDGDWHVEIVEPGNKVAPGAAGIGWMVPVIKEIVDKQKPVTVVIDPSRPAGALIQPLKNLKIDVLTPNQRDTAGACALFYDAMTTQDGGTRVRHLRQPELDRAVGTARKYELGNGAFTFVRKSSGLTVSPLYCVVLALHGLLVKGSMFLPEPDIFF